MVRCWLTIARPQETVAPPLYATPAASPLVFSDGSTIALWRVTPEQLPIAHPADIPSDILVSFVGWTLDGSLTAGESATLDLFWRVDGCPLTAASGRLPPTHTYSTGMGRA